MTTLRIGKIEQLVKDYNKLTTLEKSNFKNLTNLKDDGDSQYDKIDKIK